MPGSAGQRPTLPTGGRFAPTQGQALGVLVLAAELFNAAIEQAVDYIFGERHQLAGQAKDAGSVGVAVTEVAAGLVWVLLLMGLV